MPPYFSGSRSSQPIGIVHGRLEPCSAGIAADRQTDRHSPTHRPSTVTLAARDG